VLGAVLERYLFLSDSLFGNDWLTRPSFLGICAVILLVFASYVVKTFRLKQAATRELEEVSR
jgi:hypothetical protein